MIRKIAKKKESKKEKEKERVNEKDNYKIKISDLCSKQTEFPENKTKNAMKFFIDNTDASFFSFFFKYIIILKCRKILFFNYFE